MHLRRVLARARQRQLAAHLFDLASSMVLVVRRLVSTTARVHVELEVGLPLGVTESARTEHSGE